MKNPHNIILRPHITERTVGLSYGDDKGALLRMQHAAKKTAKDDKKARDIKVSEEEVVRKYTFIVATDANKIEIKQALEAIYNEGKKTDQTITVTAVHTIKVLGKQRRRGKSVGFEPDRKKAIVTLGRGQMLEDYGV
jgi:large subunit ribosomal protein L23